MAVPSKTWHIEPAWFDLGVTYEQGVLAIKMSSKAMQYKGIKGHLNGISSQHCPPPPWHFLFMRIKQSSSYLVFLLQNCPCSLPAGLWRLLYYRRKPADGHSCCWGIFANTPKLCQNQQPLLSIYPYKWKWWAQPRLVRLRKGGAKLQCQRHFFHDFHRQS